MSRMVSFRPSDLNQSNETFWMSIRLGRSRTCFKREKLFRARGAATLVVKRYSLPQNWRFAKMDRRKRRDVGATLKGSERGVSSARAGLRRPPRNAPNYSL